MKREIGWDEITHDDRSVVTVGTFDGVHRGHQAIIEYLQQRAREQAGPSRRGTRGAAPDRGNDSGRKESVHKKTKDHDRPQ